MLSISRCRSLQRIVIAVAITWIAGPAPTRSAAAAEDVAPSAYECRFTEERIKIDGRADEEAWKLAQPVADFRMPWLREGSDKPPTATRARLLWDREHLYFYAEMEDSDLYADVKEHDGQTWDNDVIELFLKPADDKPGYYEFQVSAGGYNRFKADGDFEFESAVKLDGTLNRWSDRDTGWTAEGRLAWKDFARTGGRPEPGERWKFALCRYDYSVDFEGPALSTSAPLRTNPTPKFHYFEDYAPIEFVGPAKLPRGDAALPPQTRSPDMQPPGSRPPAVEPPGMGALDDRSRPGSNLIE